jgi:alkylation response protein AidB-like acyl-CoA dehydrogenase
MCDRAVRRVAFGGPLADKQLIQQMVFETAAEIRACRHIALDAAEQMDRGDPARVEIGMIKVLTARMFHNAVDRAIQVHGGMGVTGDLPRSGRRQPGHFTRGVQWMSGINRSARVW